MKLKMLFLITFLVILIGNLCVQKSIEAIMIKPPTEKVEPKVNDLKILVLIIACDQNPDYTNAVANDPVYMALQRMWRLYMNTHPQVESYFIKSNPELANEFEIYDNTIWCKGEETWIPGILNKTVISMEAMLPRLHEFDYVIRTNLSSFYIFPRLLKFLEGLPREKCYSGMDCDNWGYYVNGAGIILSSDLVQMLVNNKSQLMNHSIIDDVVIGYFFAEHGIDIIKVPPRMDILSWTDWEAAKDNIPSDVFHIRARNGEGRRVPDELLVQSQLIKMFYGIDVNRRTRIPRTSTNHGENTF